jgi:hypothetical protein
MATTDALYVYGVVPKGTPPDVFANAGAKVELVVSGDLAAITSRVPLAEYGAEALETNLKDPAWLEEKVNAHNAVLVACVGATTVVPFRFGAIYRDEEQVRKMLSERSELRDTLARLDGAVEVGVKALLDPEALRGRLAHERGLDAAVGSGRAYMMWKRLERELDREVRSFAASCADASHERLAAAAADARVNPAQHPSVAGGQMVLNGAYLVRSDRDGEFRETLSELQARYADDGVTYQLTGPWPPYNFVDDEEPA